MTKNFLEAASNAIFHAIDLAQKARGQTAPNPMVGSVVLDDTGAIVADGYHQKAGTPHAEVHAINLAQQKGIDLFRATLVVTLEPCGHFGRTPPCVDLILASGIKKLVVGALDPNPKMQGQSLQKLRAGGVEVSIIPEPLHSECRKLIRGFETVMKFQRPFVTCKAAVSIDGRLAASDGSSQWITGPEARDDAHLERSSHDGILVGVGTVLADDPQLNIRHGKIHPLKKVILDSRLRTPIGARALKTAGPVYIYVKDLGQGLNPLWKEQEPQVQIVHENPFDLSHVLQGLAQRGVQELLVEGGAEVLGSFIGQGLWDRLILYMAPLFLGDRGLSLLKGVAIDGLEKAVHCASMTVKPLGQDFKFEGFNSVYGFDSSDQSFAKED